MATDGGVAYSNDGTRWHAVTDAEGETLVMKKLAVEGTTVYGTTGQYVYQLKENASTCGNRLHPKSRMLCFRLLLMAMCFMLGLPAAVCYVLRLMNS